MFVVIEGIDGSGKSSIIDRIKKNVLKCEENCIDKVLFISMPSNNETGIRVREEITNDGSDSYKVKDLFVEDFKYTIKHIIKPALKAKKIVICDRYIYSLIAYQLETVSTKSLLDSLRTIDIVYPDIVFLLDIDPKIAMNRLSGKKKDSIESKGIEFFKAVRRNFIIMAETNKDVFKVLDATCDLDTLISSISLKYD